MELKKARKMTSVESSGSPTMKAARAALSAMPIGTLSTSSTNSTIPVMYINSPLWISALFQRSVFCFCRLLEDAQAAQLLDAAVDLEEQRDHHEREPGEQHRQERPHGKRQALRPGFVLPAVEDFRDAPPHTGEEEHERDDLGDDLDDLGRAAPARPDRRPPRGHHPHAGG